MSVSYDIFTDGFLYKVNEYDLIDLAEDEAEAVVDAYMKKAIAEFRYICEYDLVSTADDDYREFDVDIADEDIYEIVDIVSEGMLVQWLKPYIYRQELIQNVLNTSDFSTYSPAELVYRLREVYEKAQKDFTQAMREYSYNHGRLDNLHI